MAEGYDRVQRLFDLRRKKYAGTLSPEERAELDGLNAWAQRQYGLFDPVEAEAETGADAADTISPYVETGGESDFDPNAPVGALDAQGNPLSFTSFDEWGKAMGLQFGMGAPGYDKNTGQTTYAKWGDVAKAAISPMASIAKGAMGKQVIAEHDKPLNLAEIRNNPELARRIGIPEKYITPSGSEPGAPDMGGGESRGAGVDIAGPGTAEALSEWGYEPSDFGESESADSGTDSGPDASGHDTDPGGDFRMGGYTGLGRNRMLEPDRPAGTVHEGEYVIPAEAVEAIGIPALDRLRMMRQPGGGVMITMAERPRSGIAALDALSGMPRKQGRGLYHSRRMGRVMGGGAPSAPMEPSPDTQPAAEAMAPGMPHTARGPADMSDAMAPNVGNGLMRRKRLGGM